MTFVVLWLPLSELQAQQDAGSAEAITIEGARIQGEQELPTVLYVVPWQPLDSQGPEPMERRLMTGEPPQILEREDFQRRLRYHQTPYDQRSQKSQE